MVTHWVVVADAARARTFVSDLMLEELLPLEGRVHPASRLKAHDLVAGDRGSTREMRGGAKSRFERHTDPHQAEADHFAKELAEMIGLARLEHRFDRLILVAPPAFLGRLRAHLDDATARTVVLEVAREWVDLSVDELTTRVRSAVSDAFVGGPEHASAE